MADKLTSQSPCEVKITPNPFGGVRIELFVPTFSGGATFVLEAERDSEKASFDTDGDWRVYIPWLDDLSGSYIVAPNMCEVSNGICYLGAPDIEVDRA